MRKPILWPVSLGVVVISHLDDVLEMTEAFSERSIGKDILSLSFLLLLREEE